MKTKQYPAPPAWSASALSLHTQCPLKFRFSRIDKIPEPQAPALARGIAIHKMCEDYIKGITSVVPNELKHFEKELNWLQAEKVSYPKCVAVEAEWAFRQDWSITSWFAKDVWVRAKLDVVVLNPYTDIATVIDWKTGKFNLEFKVEEYMEQLELYALTTMLMYPELQEVTPVLGFVDYGIKYPDVPRPSFTREDVPNLKLKWKEKSSRMMSDTIYPAKPNKLCGWCHYRASNKANGGGQCDFG